MRLARSAGSSPNSIPVKEAIASAVKIAHTGILAGTGVHAVTADARPHPMSMPTSAPSAVMAEASTRNCHKISLPVAPTAFPNSDLSGALRNADEHDADDSYAAHEDTGRGERHHHEEKDGGELIEEIQDLSRRDRREVVLLTRTQAAHPAHRGDDVVLRALERNGVPSARLRFWAISGL